MQGSVERARDALRSPDFRRLFAIRLVSQSADGLFQAALVSAVVFSPERTNTAMGFALATLVVALPFSIVGPFTGVFIDRWSRRRILVVAPWLRAALVWLVLFNPTRTAVPFYAGALWVLSVNRFYLATAVAIVPRLVPTEDLLMANSMATVGGTVALLAGVFVGGWMADLAGNAPVVIVAGAMWLAGSWIGARIASPLMPRQLRTGDVRDEVRRVADEFGDGLRRLVRTPRATGPIASITLDQMGQGIVLVLSLVVFRERFREGVGSFANVIGAGGVGVLVGILTVGELERRLAKERIVAGAFLVGGAVLIAVATHITGWSVLVASFGIGVTFAWKKIPIDTLVQESIPDGYRGRVFAVYDVLYNLSRVVAGFIAVPLLPRVGAAGSVAIVGVVFVLYTPVLPAWIRRVPELRVRFATRDAGDRPLAVVWGGVEERVDVQRSWTEERDGRRAERFRLGLEDGTTIEISKAEGEAHWRLERELS